MREASPRLILEQKEAVAEMQRPFAFRIFPHRKCAGLVSLWGFGTFSGSEIARMAVLGGRYSSFDDILAHFQDDKISLNVLSCEMLLHLSIFRLESPVQDTHPMAQGGTPWHQMQRDSALFPLGVRIPIHQCCIPAHSRPHLALLKYSPLHGLMQAHRERTPRPAARRNTLDFHGKSCALAEGLALASNGPVHTRPLVLQGLVGKDPKPT